MMTTPHALDDRFETLSISTLPTCPHVVVVALNRPRKRNAINAKMWREIGQVFGLLGTTGDGCRCVLLMGNGKAFSAGLDVTDESLLVRQDGNDGNQNDVARRAMAFRSQILEMQQCLTAVETCAVPVIAAIHGPCIGAGVDLICCADVRLASQCAVFSIREVRLGLAADVGTLQRLPKIVGHGSTVRQLCYTGQDFDASLAERIGLVSQVLWNREALWQAACALCRQVASNSPVAVAGTKLSLNYSRDRSVADGLNHIAMHNSMALMTDDWMASFVAANNNGGRDPATFADMLPHAKL